ncbi:hypothetical protein [Rhodobacter capsulatus]|uniref:hypothetical protein n=1 Tax=Rhodobacter capsulatus TaxID=1061 RepID=UPI004024FE00
MNTGKMVILKPIVWNDQGYRWPSGRVASSGFTKEYGYGQEEWNGRDDWVWKGWRVFHTQVKGAMHHYAEVGRLGIIMTAMMNGQFFAVGVACNVFQNTEKDAAEISEALGLSGYTDRMWKVGSIREAHASKAAFSRHWAKHTHVMWRCPITHYSWFEEPLLIIPNDLIPCTPPRQALAKMHGSYQAIRPDQALAVVQQVLPSDHSVVGWLSTDDFDPVRNQSIRHAPKPAGKSGGSAAAASNSYTRYLQENEIVVSPLHARLQEAFVSDLKRRRITEVRENIERVDLRYRDAEKGSVLVEVKPTEPATIRFAIRTAIGQLLDYRQRVAGQHALLIVIEDEPADEELRLALSNGFGLAWRCGSTFKYAWPPN